MKNHLHGLGLAAVMVFAAVAAQAGAAGEAVLTISKAEHRFALFAQQSDWAGSPQFPTVNMSLVPTEAATRKQFGSFNLGFELRGGAAHNPEARFMRRGGPVPKCCLPRTSPRAAA